MRKVIFDPVVYNISRLGCSETLCWVLRKPSVHAPFRASFFLWPDRCP